MTGKRTVQGVNDKGRFAAARHAGNAGKYAKRKRRGNVVKIVFNGGYDCKVMSFVRFAPTFWNLYLAHAAQILPSQALWAAKAREISRSLWGFGEDHTGPTHEFIDGKVIEIIDVSWDIVQDNVELEQKKEPLDNNLEGGVIEDDNPIIMDDDDILDDESEEELINENEIDIPDIENEELIEDDDNDFLVEEDEIEDSDLIITPKSDDE